MYYVCGYRLDEWVDVLDIKDNVIERYPWNKIQDILSSGIRVMGLSANHIEIRLPPRHQDTEVVYNNLLVMREMIINPIEVFYKGVFVSDSVESFEKMQKFGVKFCSGRKNDYDNFSLENLYFCKKLNKYVARASVTPEKLYRIEQEGFKNLWGSVIRFVLCDSNNKVFDSRVLGLKDFNPQPVHSDEEFTLRTLCCGKPFWSYLKEVFRIGFCEFDF